MNKSTFKQFGRDLRDAVKGIPHDYTNGSIGRAITLLAIPMMLEMIMESIFALVDIYFVGKLGAEAVVTIGMTETLMILVTSLGAGLAIGATAVVARRIGEKRVEAARSAALQSIYLSILVSVPIAVAGILFASPLLVGLGAAPDVVQSGSLNMAIMLGGNATLILLTVINGVFRGAGNPATSMRILLVANGINIILDPLLIFGVGPFPELGVVGAAVATNIGRGLGVCYQIYHLFNGEGKIRIDWHHLTWDGQAMKRIMAISAGTVLQILLRNTSYIAILRLIAIFGSQAVAGYTIGLRIITLALLPTWGLAGAAATLVGQNLGAGKPQRASLCVWRTSAYSTLFLLVVTLAFVLSAHQIIGLFTTDSDVETEGAVFIYTISIGFVFYGAGMALLQGLNGAGDTRWPTIINLVFNWFLQMPLAYYLAVTMEMGPSGIYISMSATLFLMAVAAGWVFYRGKWKHKQI